MPSSTLPELPGSADDIRDLLVRLPGPDEAAAEAAKAREPQLTKPPGSLGRLEDLSAWAAAWSGRHPAEADRPGIIIFAGNHGVVARGISAYPPEVTAQMVANFEAGGAAINQLATAAGAELLVRPLDLDRPTEDFTQGPALTEADFVTCFREGLAAVNPDWNLLALGEMGIGNTTSAAALSMALFGGAGEDWAGPGTGLKGAELIAKAKIVHAAVLRHATDARDALDQLRRLGGRELVAMAGAIVAARYLRIPVLLDGFIGTAAAAALAVQRQGALDHCQCAHVSGEPGHQLLLENLKREPLLDLGLRLGEGSGAALAISIVKAALATHAGMATFAEAGVSDKG
ncbi:MAG: nicotinate-nucleotide--dimethylbenzimidazole phosphoribosyltransferase [Magnetovibrionaceae bacterium]